MFDEADNGYAVCVLRGTYREGLGVPIRYDPLLALLSVGACILVDRRLDDRLL